jgi:O-antigen ligase
MGLLKYLFILFILIFPAAEVGRLQLPNGVAFSLNDILLALVIVVWFGWHILKKKKINLGKLTKPILLFSAIGLISLLVNFSNLGANNLLISSLYLVRWIAYALIYMIFFEFEPKFKHKLALLLLGSGFTVIALGYIQFFFYPSLRNLYYLGWDEHLYRMFSSFLDPNFAGAFFVLFFLFSLTFVYKYFQKNRLKTLITIGISAVTLLAVYLTYSRSALIMLAVSVVTFLIIKGQKKLIAVVLIALILIIFLLPKSFTTEGTNLLRQTSSLERLDSIAVGVRIFQQSPILGVGFNAYRFAQHKVGLNNIYWQVTHSGAGTDNGFLFILTTAGIVGLIAFLYLLFKVFILAKLNFKKNIYAAVLFSGLAGLIVNGLFVNSLFYVLILEWVWILAALTESS